MTIYSKSYYIESRKGKNKKGERFQCEGALRRDYRVLCVIITRIHD